MIGFVSLLGTHLLDLWPGFDEWLKSKNILQRVYQGRGWDGNNSNPIIKNLDELELAIKNTHYHLTPFVECLKNFRSVKGACFGNFLETGIEESISKLKNSFISTQELALIFGKILSLTWKSHIILCHVVPFIKYLRCGLGKYAEQCGESIHAKFKPTWSR